MLEWDPDHHRISFPGLFSDISWAYTSSRKPGYTKSGLLGRFMGFTGRQILALGGVTLLRGRPKWYPLLVVLLQYI